MTTLAHTLNPLPFEVNTSPSLFTPTSDSPLISQLSQVLPQQPKYDNVRISELREFSEFRTLDKLDAFGLATSRLASSMANYTKSNYNRELQSLIRSQHEV